MAIAVLSPMNKNPTSILGAILLPVCGSVMLRTGSQDAWVMQRGINADTMRELEQVYQASLSLSFYMHKMTVLEHRFPKESWF